MAKQSIDLDTPQPGGGLGDNARVAFEKCNNNFDEIYSRIGYFGATAPEDTYPFMLWCRTSDEKLFRRNAADNAWIDLGPAFDFMYGRKNIVGTVSSSAGIPTGAIIESGNNGGTQWWVRWADGTQILWLDIADAQVAMDSAYGGQLYLGSWSWTYSKPFIVPPKIINSTFKWSNGASWPGPPSGVTASSAILRGLDIASRTTGDTWITAMAIGQWSN